MKNLICIECPKECYLSVDIENCKVVKVSGNKCPNGEKYAVSEIEFPSRILTTTVLLEDASIKMLPVRTDKPIPKNMLMKAMKTIKKLKINSPIKSGDIVTSNLLGLKVNLIATRTVK